MSPASPCWARWSTHRRCRRHQLIYYALSNAGTIDVANGVLALEGGEINVAGGTLNVSGASLGSGLIDGAGTFNTSGTTSFGYPVYFGGGAEG